MPSSISLFARLPFIAFCLFHPPAHEVCYQFMAYRPSERELYRAFAGLVSLRSVGEHARRLAAVE
jgi:hypothetical protein